MLQIRLNQLGALALIAAASAALHTPLLAQSSEGSAGPVHLAFGYDCGDRFRVHNDGSQPVNIEYAIAGNRDRSPLPLNGGETVTITSPSSAAVELWVNGKLAASEPKGSRACAPSAGDAGDVVVRRFSATDSTAPAATGAAVATYGVAPPVYYAAPYPDYPYYYGYAYPPYPYLAYGSYYPYGYYGPAAGIRIGGGIGFGRGVIGGRGIGIGRGRR